MYGYPMGVIGAAYKPMSRALGLQTQAVTVHELNISIVGKTGKDRGRLSNPRPIVFYEDQ